KGVTLISDISPWRRPRRLSPRPAEPPPCRADIAIYVSPSGCRTRHDLLIDLPRQYGGELVRKSLHPDAQPGRVRRQLVVGYDGWNCGEQTHRRRQQRLGNARCHDGEIGGFGAGDGLERGHDPDHRAEEAYE